MLGSNGHQHKHKKKAGGLLLEAIARLASVVCREPSRTDEGGNSFAFQAALNQDQ